MLGFDWIWAGIGGIGEFGAGFLGALDSLSLSIYIYVYIYICITLQGLMYIYMHVSSMYVFASSGMLDLTFSG